MYMQNYNVDDTFELKLLFVLLYQLLYMYNDSAPQIIRDVSLSNQAEQYVRL